MSTLPMPSNPCNPLKTLRKKFPPSLPINSLEIAIVEVVWDQSRHARPVQTHCGMRRRATAKIK
jgi:hypothetical protein